MVTSITSQNQSMIEQSKNPVVIDIFATWCGPCMEMRPIFEEIAEEYKNKYTFFSVNVDESRDIAIHYGITSIPTFIFIHNGKILGKDMGYMSKDEFEQKMKTYFDNKD